MLLADRVQETTTTTGYGPYSLGGAATGYRDFASVAANGDVVTYCIVGGAEWAVIKGTFNSGSPPTLSVDEIEASSNGNAAVNFSAGSKDVFLVVSAKTLSRSKAGRALAMSRGIAPL